MDDRGTPEEERLGFSASVAARRGGGSVVTVFGEVDLDSASKLGGTLTEAIEHEGPVDLDLRGLSFIDSTGIAALVTAARRLHEDGRTLRVIGARQRIRRTFELAGLPAQGWIAFEPFPPG